MTQSILLVSNLWLILMTLLFFIMARRWRRQAEKWRELYEQSIAECSKMMDLIQQNLETARTNGDIADKWKQLYLSLRDKTYV